MRATKLPSSLLGLLAGDTVQLLASHIGVAIECRLARLPDRLEVVTDLLLHGIVAEHECASEISLPSFEDWAEIDEQNIVLLDSAIFGVFVVRLKRIGSTPNDSFVPVCSDSVSLVAELVTGRVLVCVISVRMSKHKSELRLLRVVHRQRLTFPC